MQTARALHSEQDLRVPLDSITVFKLHTSQDQPERLGTETRLDPMALKWRITSMSFANQLFAWTIAA